MVRGRQYVRLSATHTQGLRAGWMGSHERVNLQVIPTRRPGRRLMHMPWTRAPRQARLQIPRYRLPRNLHEKSAAARVLIAVAVYTGLVAEWLAWWTQAQKARVQIAAATLSGNSLRQTVHTHRAFFTEQSHISTWWLLCAAPSHGPV